MNMSASNLNTLATILTRRIGDYTTESSSKRREDLLPKIEQKCSMLSAAIQNEISELSSKETTGSPKLKSNVTVNGAKLTDLLTPLEPSPPSGQKSRDKQISGGHYKGMAIQPTEYITANKIPWLEANAIKYITRHATKGGKSDIEKAIHYLEWLLEENYGDADGG